MDLTDARRPVVCWKPGVRRIPGAVLVAALIGCASWNVADGQPASPARCRDGLRPVLLQSEPDPAILADLKRLCAAQAEAGDPEAVYGLSLLYLGLIQWQPERAIALMRRAAADGVAEAQYWLAWQYEAGPLLDNDASLALRWYRAAADREHRLALQRMATIYADGEMGVVPDTARAVVYRARAERCEQ